MLPALNSHLFKFDFVVPHLDGPTVPVTTLNLVAGIFPLLEIVAVGGNEVVDALHPD
jgi:hypothetical protein